MPDLPPVEERFVADASQYVAALNAMAAAAERAAEAQAKIVAGIEAMNRAMDAAAAGAEEAAAAEERLAEAEGQAAGAAAEQAASEEAAAGAAQNLARANDGAAAAAFTLARYQKTLNDALMASFAAERAAANAADAARDAYEGLAAAEAIAAEEAEKLAAAEAAGSLRAAQGVANAAELAAADEALAQAQDVAAEAARVHAAAEIFLATAMTDAERDALGLTTVLAGTAAANKVAADATNATNRALGLNIGWLRLGVGNWLTFAHWVVAGSAEFLAVAVPALVALAAGLAVAAQGAYNTYQHFNALYDATESTHAAFGQTVGTVLGLGDALQKAQDAANPGVYEVLGSAINDLRGRTGMLAQAGLEVVHNFDEFAARVSVDLRQGLGTEIQGLLSGMVHDLQQFGQILGNLGHALLNFAAAMPGLAHVLLTIATYLSSVIEVASRAGVLLTFAMAMEEMYRWGGLVLNILTRLTGQMGLFNSIVPEGAGFIQRFGAYLETLAIAGGRALIWAGQMIGRLAGFSEAFGKAGTAVSGFGSDLASIAGDLGPGMIAGIAGIAAAGIGLMIVMDRLKDSTQQFAANAVKAVQAAGDASVLSVATQKYAQLNTQVQSVSASLSHMSGVAGQAGAVAGSSWAQWNPMIAGFGGLGRLTAGFASQMTALGAGFAKMPGPVNGAMGAILSFFGAFAPAAKASSDLTALQTAESAVARTGQTVVSNLGLLASHFHISESGALALANAAGVNLQQGLTAGSEAMKIAVQQINNLRQGLGAMNAPIGVVGADMQAVGVQSQLAASKVSQVNQAMDAFIGTTTGGMNSLMQFLGTLHQMGHDASSSSVQITGAVTSIARDAAKMGYTLQGIGPKAQQSWQQFDASVQQANSVLDTMRVGMAEGVVSSTQYLDSIKAAGGALLPFAAHNKTALAIVSQLAQEAGFPATNSMRTLAREFGVTGSKARNELAGGVERAIARMANLNQIAKNLSVTVGSQLDSAMSAAIVKTSHITQAYNTWANDMRTNKGPSVLQADLKRIQSDQNFVNSATQKATTLMNNSSKAADNLGQAYKKTAAETATATQKATNHIVALDKGTAASEQAAAKTNSLTGYMSTNASVTTHASTAAQAASQQVQHLGTVAIQTRAQVGDVNNEIRTMSGIAGPATSAMARLAASFQVAGNDAATATGNVRGLQSAIAALSSKTITITTVMNTVHRAGGGPVVPGIPFTVGEQGEELFVPSQPGYIIPHNQTEQILAASGGLGQRGGQQQPIQVTAQGDIHAHLTVDGQEIATATQPYQLRYAHRNGRQITALA